MNKQNIWIAVIGLIVVTILSGYFFMKGMDTRSRPVRQITVKGLSERVVKSDSASWSIKINDVVATEDLARKKLSENVEKVKIFLKTKGFADDEVSLEYMNISQELYNQSTQRYVLNALITVETKKVDLMSEVYREIYQLVLQGVGIGNAYYSAASSAPTFSFSGLQNLKEDMLAESLQGAQSTAEAMARNLKVRVEKMITANQGVFSISSQDQGQSEDGSVQQKSTINKVIRVVSTVTYQVR